MEIRDQFSGSTASRPDPRLAFWKNHFLWPEDTPSHVFLARAILKVGEVLYGDKWNGKEPLAEQVEPLPETLDPFTVTAEVLRGSSLLLEYSPDYRRRCDARSKLVSPTEEEWATIVPVAKALAEERRQSLMRFYDVCQRLARTFRNGVVLTSCRAFDGGPVRDLDCSIWNTEYFWGRFDSCRIDLSDPFSQRPSSQSGSWLFVETACFERALSGAQDDCRTGTDLATLNSVYLSPYVRCMIDATIRLGLCANNQLKTEFLIAELPKFWKLPVQLSGRDLKSMATLMREPESKAGRGKKTMQ